MDTTFAEISLVIVLAAILGILAKIFKQPTIIAYLITGIVIASAGVLGLDSHNVLNVMATFGITFLLFLVGLEMRFSEIKSIGKAALLTGLGQIIFTSLVGFGLVKLLGFNVITSLYIAVALTFSSTIIVIKLLSEKRDLQSLYGRIVVGFLIIQDLVAILMLIILSSLQKGELAINLPIIIFSITKGLILVAATLWLGQKILPWIFEKLARSPELLFIVSVAWAVGIAHFVSSKTIGFSIEIGGFLAGLALARSAEQFQIDARIKSLRDFFIVMFFVILGSSLIIGGNLSDIIIPAIILSLFILIGNPLIVLIIMGLLGFRKRTSFLASVTVAQISEFSLILMAMGLKLGHVDEKAVSLVTLVGVVTILISTYLILNSEKIFNILRPYLKIFEKSHPQEEPITPSAREGHTILAGAHRLGQRILMALDKKHLLIVDFDPTIVNQLKSQGYQIIFGDITDTEIQNHVNFDKAKTIISTVPHLDENILIIERIKSLKEQKKTFPLFIATATQEWEARILYDEGADYVILPYFICGQHIANLIKEVKLDLSVLNKIKRHDQKFIWNESIFKKRGSIYTKKI